MHSTVLITFAVALAIAVALPGPGILSVVSCAIAHGFESALAMIAGLVLGDLIYFTFAIGGLAALARSMGEFFYVVKLIGGVYLIWLGVKLWQQSRRERAQVDAAPRVRRGRRRSFVAGFLVTISNPKVIGFYAGLLPTFVDLGRLTLTEALTMAGVVVLTVAAIPALYAYAADRSRRFLTSSKRMKLLDRTAGTVLIASGITVATR